jgi:hypothetical protein
MPKKADHSLPSSATLFSQAKQNSSSSFRLFRRNKLHLSTLMILSLVHKTISLKAVILSRTWYLQWKEISGTELEALGAGKTHDMIHHQWAHGCCQLFLSFSSAQLWTHGHGRLRQRHALSYEPLTLNFPRRTASPCGVIPSSSKLLPIFDMSRRLAYQWDRRAAV